MNGRSHRRLATAALATAIAAGPAWAAPAAADRGWQAPPAARSPAPTPPTPASAPTPEPSAPADPPRPLERPDPPRAQHERDEAVTRLRAGEVGEAVELLRSAHAHNPTNASIANDLGFALAKLGARREAEAFYRRALALDPRRTLAYVNFAELLAESPERWQRRDEVLAFLDQGLSTLRDEPHMQKVLAVAVAGFEQSVGRLGDARRRLAGILAASPATSVRKRALDRLAAIDDDERALALADWPQPPLAADAAHALTQAEAELAAGRAPAALERASRLTEANPAASAPRFLRGRALEALGRHDEAARELGVLLQLRPSHAGAWRLLGTILALHGGALEAERADEALRRALALEPSWDNLRELRRRVAGKRAAASSARAARERRLPSPRAQSLLEDAQRWLGVETPEMAISALADALADSPAFVEAAATLFSLGGEVPAATVTALWDDGEGLARLAAELLRIRRDEATAALVGPWLDRAAELGSAEGRFQRALLRAESGDGKEALADLVAYVASDVDPPRLSEARALRSTLDPTAKGSTDVALARRLLLADRPREAARVLGGACRPGLAADALVELGRIAEYEARMTDALACHRLALGSATLAPDGEGRQALERIARIAARTPEPFGRTVATELAAGRKADVPAAAWALARLAAADERWDEALRLGDVFLRSAAPDDPLRGEAALALEELGRRAVEARATRAARFRGSLILGGAAAALLLALLFARRLRGRTVAGALARAPDLYPDVASAVAELRHDVLKHRASALSLLGEGGTGRADIARTLREPTPTSAAVATAYERLGRAAAATGVALRRLEREPVFGALHRALHRAEELLARPPSRAHDEELAAIDLALRDQHGPALARLLACGPRTRLDPAQVAGWMSGLAAPGTAPAGPSLTPGLHLPALDVEVPVTPAALHAILSNLVRNAVAALCDASDPRVLVRVEAERDAAGRRLVTLLVADSAPAPLSLEDVEGRDSQRGLGIVRDLVRRWGGHVVVRPESAPFVKAVGAAFPMVPAGGPPA